MQTKKITFLIASLMAVGAYSQVLPPCTGFYKENPDATECFICPGEYCLSCSQDLKCQEYDLCPNIGELPNVQGTACFGCNVGNCLYCSSADYCQQCDTGFNRNQRDGTCYQCDNPLCANCDPMDTAVCTECVDPTFKVSIDKTTCYECLVPGCNSCNADGTCAQCQVITQKPNEAGDACVECSGAFCSNCNQPNVCAVALPCTDPVTEKPNIAGDACFDCQIIDCERCNQNMVCAQCTTGLVPNNDASACVSCFAGCKTCSDDNVCIECQNAGQKPGCDGRACIPCAATFCETCSSAEVCLKYSLCPNPGELTNVQGTECFSCNISGGACNFCSANDVCQVCQDGFKPSVDGSACVKCDLENCLECSEDNKCFTCRGLMVPSNTGACVSCPLGCASCNDAGECLDCPKDCANGCTDGKCDCPATCTTSCDDKGNCLPQCPPNCLECDDSYKCNKNKCADGYETTKWGACVKTNIKCPGSYVSADGSHCEDGYYYHH